jgi:dipeptidyl aminopeptidase/acylaminoacyl peptidase
MKSLPAALIAIAIAGICPSLQASPFQTLIDPPFSHPALAPDGRHVAVLETDSERKQALLIVEVDTLKTQAYYARTSRKEKASVVDFFWVDKDTLVLTSDAQKEALSLHQIKIGDRSVTDLDTKQKFTLLDSMPSSSRYLVVVETESGGGRIEERDTSDRSAVSLKLEWPSPISGCVTDSRHEPRMIRASKAAGGGEAWFWKDQNEWKATSIPAWSQVYAMEFGKTDSAMVGGWFGASAPGIYIYDLNAGSVKETIVDHPSLAIQDFSHAMVHPYTKAILGIHFRGELPQDLPVSGNMVAMQNKVDSLLPGTNNLMRGWDNQMEVVLVERFVMDAPHHLVWVDLKGDQTKLIMINGGKVELEHTGRSTVFQFANRAGTPLSAMLTLPRSIQPSKLPLVILVRDEPWDELDRQVWVPEAHYLSTQGMAVLRVNHRGARGRHGALSVDLGKIEGIRAMFGDMEDAVQELVKAGIVDPAKVGIAGAGKGAWFAATAPMVTPGVYAAVVSLNGVYDLELYRSSFDAEGAIRHTLFLPFANPVSALDAASLAVLSPFKRSQEYAAHLFVSYGDWSSTAYKDHAQRFLSEARKNKVRVRSYNHTWWGNQMNPAQRIKAWQDAASLLSAAFK